MIVGLRAQDPALPTLLIGAATTCYHSFLEPGGPSALPQIPPMPQLGEDDIMVTGCGKFKLLDALIVGCLADDGTRPNRVWIRRNVADPRDGVREHSMYRR